MVVGSNPGAIYRMDMTFFTLICIKNCIVCLKRLKINEKEAVVGPYKNRNNKEVKTASLQVPCSLQLQPAERRRGRAERG